MNKLLKNYEQVFRRRSSCQVLQLVKFCGPQLMAGRRRRSFPGCSSQAMQLVARLCMDRGGLPARGSSVSGSSMTGQWFPCVWYGVPFPMVRRDNLQFVHTKRLICSQICARVEPPGTFVKMHKRDECLIDTRPLFLLYHHFQRSPQLRTTNRNRI